MPVNILSAKFVFPKRVYILAPGYLGRSAYHRIPYDGFVIAVNKAIMIERVAHKHIWMAEDVALMGCKWFRESARQHIREMNYIFDPQPTPVLDSGKMYHHYPHVQYVYTSGNLMYKKPRYRMIKQKLRGGLTISCKAMQLALHCGARELILCGVDMMGRKYFDDVLTESGHIDDDSTEHWQQLEGLDKFIKNAIEAGLVIKSLSETALNVEVI